MAYDTAFLKAFGAKLAQVRKSKGISQEKLADMVELHRTYIGFVEQGKRNPSINNTYKISKALGIKLSDLLKGF